MAAYPRMLYRPGTTLRVWNAHDVDYTIVYGEEEEATAKAQGWTRRPDERFEEQPVLAPVWGDHDGDGQMGGSLPGDQSTVAKGRRNKGRRR